MGTKKTKKEIALEKKIAKLKKEEKKLSAQAHKIDKQLDRERKVIQKKIDDYDKQIERIEKVASQQVAKLEDRRDAFYDKHLPSQKAFNKVQDKLVKVRNALRDQAPATTAPESSRRPDREAGDEEE